MNKLLLTFFLFILSGAIVAFADDTQQVVTLKDGSQIVGQLVGINNGVYTIKAPIIGNVQANANDIVSITNHTPGTPINPSNPSNPGNSNPSNPGNPSPDNGDMDERIKHEQRELMSNPESMAILMEMAQDPQIAQLLSDPTLVEEVTHHDLHGVENNPKIRELMNNPHVQEFLRRLQAIQGHDHDHGGGH